MAKKTGLGKGLDALFSNHVVEEEKIKEGESIVNLKVIDVDAHLQSHLRLN